MMTLGPAPGFEPNFFSEYSVVLNHPIAEVFSVLATSAGHERVTRLSGLCTGFELHEADTIGISKNTPLENTSVRTVPPHEAQSKDDESIRRLSRQFFTLKETVPVFFGLLNTGVALAGTLAWDEEAKVALYESKTTSGIGIMVWKLRKFEELGGDQTRVTESIKGKCPGWVKSIVQSQSRSGHMAHMNSYHALF